MIDKNKAIEEITRNFDWEKVHKVMTFLDWTWFDSEGEVPRVGLLVICAQGLLDQVYDLALIEKDNCIVATGGFRATALVDKDTKDIFELRLSFELANWESDEDSQKYN